MDYLLDAFEQWPRQVSPAAELQVFLDLLK